MILRILFLSMISMELLNRRYVQKNNDKRLLYEVLELNFSAEDSQIRKAYNKLSKKYHPDKYGSSKKYVEIQRAFEVLSDRTKKHIYDTDGIDEVLRYEHALNNDFVERRYNQTRPK